jgi:hypothetical protein
VTYNLLRSHVRLLVLVEAVRVEIPSVADIRSTSFVVGRADKKHGVVGEIHTDRASRILPFLPPIAMRLAMAAEGLVVRVNSILLRDAVGAFAFRHGCGEGEGELRVLGRGGQATRSLPVSVFLESLLLRCCFVLRPLLAGRDREEKHTHGAKP